MNLDIGRVFSTTIETIKERIWPMIGLYAVFFAISIVFLLVGGGLLGASMAGAMMSLGAGGLDNPAALGGFGFGAIIGMIIFYVLYLALIFAQQASMSAMASPTRRVLFGDAMSAGFRAGLTSVALFLLFFIVYIIAALVIGLVFAALAFVSEILVFLGAIALLPGLIYLVCRLAVIVPVMAVEGVFNPITAINRTWQVTRGNVLGILIVMLLGALITLAILIVPGFLIFGMAGGAAAGDMTGGAVALLSIGFLLFIPLFIISQVFSVTLTTVLHSEISDDHLEEMTEMFE
ncbi:MAG: hypothetical protein AAF127_11095 [Pseudomonadota bacterium]